MTNIRPSKDAYTTTRSCEMEAYDKLDPRLKKLIQQAPEQLSAEFCLEMLQQGCSVERLLRDAERMFEENYPGWKPL